MHVDLQDVGAWCAVVGLDLSIRAFPSGDPIRDRAQLALLQRLRARLHPGLRWSTEVPLPIPGDIRAWDAAIDGETWSAKIDAETVLDDLAPVATAKDVVAMTMAARNRSVCPIAQALR